MSSWEKGEVVKFFVDGGEEKVQVQAVRRLTGFVKRIMAFVDIDLAIRLLSP